MSWFNPAWPYRQSFTIDNTSTEEDLTDFPVTINLLPASGHLFHWDLMSSPSGKDIRFANPDGQELNFEIEKCDLANHILIAHVKVPFVSGSLNSQKIYMYYGNPDAQELAASFKQATWSNNYRMVHHFIEKKGDYLDATASGNNSSSVGGSTDRTNVAHINNNPKFNAYNDNIIVPDDPSIRDIQQLTIEVWAEIDVTSSANTFYSKGSWIFETVTTDNKLQFTADWGTDGKWKSDSAIWTGTNQRHDLAVTYDRGDSGNDAILYVDGYVEPSSETSTPNGSPVSESGSNAYIANRSGNFFQWRGELDELRISSVIRTSGWINATFRTLHGSMMSLPGTLEYGPISGTSVTGWWNEQWNYRRKIYSDPDGSAYTSGQHFMHFSLDVDSLVSQGKILAGYGDLRVVRQTNSSQDQLPRYIASSASPSRIYFPTNYNLPSGLNIGDISTVNYYVYYGNSSPGDSSPTYYNFNAPQAPYSVITTTDPGASGYYDRFLFRLNDDSGPTPEDSTGHFTSANAISGVVFGQEGRLDKCIYLPGTYGQFIRIPGRHFLNPSGRWMFDCWYRTNEANQAQNYLFERVEDNVPTYDQWEIIVNGGAQIGNVKAKESTLGIIDLDSTPSSQSGVWIYYRTIFYETPDKQQAWIGTSGYELATTDQTTSFSASTSSDSHPAFIGVYMNLNEQDQGGVRFNGWVEQMRFGMFPGELAPNGITNDWLDPYWIANEYTLKLESEEAGIITQDVPIAHIGGYTYGVYGVPISLIGGLISAGANPDFNRVALLGGFTKAEAFSPPIASLGGYINSLPLVSVPIAKLGGAVSGVLGNEANIGGYIIGYPENTDYAEMRNRILVKANSALANDQELNIDAQLILKALGYKEFNARIDISSTDFAEFMGKVKVTKYRTPPTVEILSVTPSSGVLENGVKQVTVVASGTLGDGNEWQHAYIDFGDPLSNTNPLTYNINASISGFSTDPVWQTTHDYNASGIYSIVVRGVDDYGMVGSDIYILNLASGLTAGIDYPYLSIAATPRSGEVPDSVLVYFTSTPSGIGNIQSPADKNILWNFGNRENSQLKNPKTYYNSPGLYAPTLRWRYINSNGQVIWVSDSLLLGYNR